MFGLSSKPTAGQATEDIYRTNDGRAFFRFRFVPETGGAWRADIQEQPSYGSRASDLHSSHRLSSGSAGTGYKICYASSPKSLRDAQKFAETWAEATWVWIKDGRRVKGF